MKGIYLNELNKKEDSLLSTAFDDYSVRYLPEDTMVLHCFQHSGINMGWDDTRMDHFDRGLAYYEASHIPLMVRNAGGRSIVSDEGVLNMSLTIRTDMSMQEAYTYYENFIKEALSPFTTEIVSGEIIGAYCPGESDLSIRGKKFCGTAQRKRKDVINLVCYISVNGDQQHRSELVKGFYEAMDTDLITINPDTMETLSVLCHQEITPDMVAQSLYRVLQSRCDETEIIDSYPTDTEAFALSLRMTQKNNTHLKK